MPKKAAAEGAVKFTVGDKVPNFNLPATGDQEVSLGRLKGKVVVLYFYPRDATPGCTIQGQNFSQLRAKFSALNAEVFGISRDSVSSHEKFKAKQNYRIELLSDVDEVACQAFGVMKLKNMYGKKVRGIERSTFVIDRDGRLLKEWRGVKVPGHAAEVLEFVRTIKG